MEAVNQTPLPGCSYGLIIWQYLCLITKVQSSVFIITSCCDVDSVRPRVDLDVTGRKRGSRVESHLMRLWRHEADGRADDWQQRWHQLPLRCLLMVGSSNTDTDEGSVLAPSQNTSQSDSRCVVLVSSSEPVPGYRTTEDEYWDVGENMM